MEVNETPQLPDDIVLDENTDLDNLPELPPGYVWGLKFIAEAEVVRADGTVKEE